MANEVNFYKGKQSSYDTKLTNNEIDDLTFYLTKDSNDVPQDAYLGKLKLTGGGDNYLPLSGGTMTGPIVETQGSYVNKIINSKTSGLWYGKIATIQLTKAFSKASSKYEIIMEVSKPESRVILHISLYQDSDSKLQIAHCYTLGQDFTFILHKEDDVTYTLYAYMANGSYLHILRCHNPIPENVTITWGDSLTNSKPSADIDITCEPLYKLLVKNNLNAAGNFYAHNITIPKNTLLHEFAQINLNTLRTSDNSVKGPIVLELSVDGYWVILYITGQYTSSKTKEIKVTYFGNSYLPEVALVSKTTLYYYPIEGSSDVYGLAISNQDNDTDLICQINRYHNPTYMTVTWTDEDLSSTPSGITIATPADFMSSGDDSAHLPLSGGTMTGNILTASTKVGYYLTDTTGYSYPGVYDNGTNLWIGAESGSSHAHAGKTIISSGWDPSSDGNAAGYPTIFISVPESGTSTTTSTKKVLHESNYSEYALPLTGGKLTGRVTMAVDKGFYSYDNEDTPRRLIALSKDNTFFIADNLFQNYITIGSTTGASPKDDEGTQSLNLRSRRLEFRFPADEGYFIPRGISVATDAGTDEFSSSSTSYLGSDGYRWLHAYIENIHGTVLSSSDKNFKKDIKNLDDKYLNMMLELQPKSFKFTNGTSNRTHIGFIAQDVEELMAKYELTDLDFAGWCKDVKKKVQVVKEAVKDEDGNIIQEEEIKEVDAYDENGNPEYIYSLRYEEFIAINTALIQRQQKQINELTEKIDSLINK